MKDVKDKDLEFYQAQSERHFKHWRAWGSWFSWGSPVGLGLFFVSLAACYWIVTNAR